jgi:serine/threonine protein kinase
VESPIDPSPKPGDVLAGKYVLHECIGAGGMGAVFRADHPTLARQVAIKVIHPHLAAHLMFVRRFHDEALAASRVRHRGSVGIIDFGVATGGMPFIAMELLRGRPLGRIISEEILPLPRALGILDQILDALDAAHTCSVVHGDVKSDNFMVEQQAHDDVVTMIDFGLARLDGAATSPGLLAGTPEYIAPELVRGAPPTSASDLYGAGVILYELLTGTMPFGGGSTSEILRRQREEAVIPPSRRRPDRGIPAAADAIVLRALAKDPGARFASAQEFRSALGSRALGRDVSAQARRRWRAAPASAGPGAPICLPIAPPDSHRVARGSDAGVAGQDELRRAIASALVQGDVRGIAEGYAALADTLAREHHLGAAIHELEEGIDVVTAGQGLIGADPDEPVSRLVASLAALYELTSEDGKARRALACADGRATLVSVAG